MRKVKKKLTVDDVKKAADSGNQTFEHWLKTGNLPVEKQSGK